MKIYVASSWRNEQQQMVVQELRKAGHEVYDFKHPTKGNAGFHWSEIDPNWQKWNTQQYREALKHDYAQFGFNRDFDAMKAADACVLVLPCGRSAHLEAGWMKGEGRRVYAYIPAECRIEPELMYGMLDGITDDIQGLLRWLANEGRETDSDFDFDKEHHLRTADRCCGNCRHGTREDENGSNWQGEATCRHPKRSGPPYELGNVLQSQVCDLWEGGAS